MADIASVNSGIMNFVTNTGGALGKIIFYLILIVIVIAACGIAYYYWKQKKMFNKIITVFDIVGQYYQPALRDRAKVVKIGTGGFEILYLQKAKVWRIGYGGRVGKDTYYFFVAKDGYWFNGMLSSNMYAINKEGGLIPIVTTNPSMRAQYTSLEKQVDSLHAEKRGFMEKYGMWVMGISFILVAGVMLWLIAREVQGVPASFGPVVDQFKSIATSLQNIANHMPGAINSGGSGGTVPIS